MRGKDLHVTRLLRWNRKMRFAVCLVGVFAILPWLVGWVISWRIYHDLNNRFGDRYAILGANQNGRPGIAFNMYRTGFMLFYRWLIPPVPVGSGAFLGVRNHLIFLISDNEWVYLATWSFRSFSMSIDSDPDQLSVLTPDERLLYLYNDADVSRIRGLRVVNIGKPATGRFYLRGYGSRDN